MMVFRFLGFIFKIVLSFLFVLTLQVEVKGRSLETHLVEFGYRFFLTRSLKKVSQDGATVIKDISLFHESLTPREIAFSNPVEYMKDVVKQSFHQKELYQEDEDRNLTDESQ